jgi:predicted ATPase
VDCVTPRAGVNPLGFILEDTHWIDPLSVDLLMAAGRAITSLQVVILTAYRPPLLQGSQTLHFT